LLVTGNVYVFRYHTGSAATNYGLFFNLTSARFEFLDGSGNEVFAINANNGKTKVANSYFLPTADGSSGQTIQTDGSGNLSFVTKTHYHDRYSTEAESERSGATATLEIYYTARPDGDGYAESEVSDVGETDTINRTLYYSTKFQADPDTAGDWTEYTTQPADNATFATAKAALLAGLNETDATAETRGTLPLSLKMVRTTVAPVTDLLLDTYPGAAAAYSVRKLDKDYTGYCMKVRRASDDAEADIGFDGNGDLDTAAIATHCGASNGFISVWYDQANVGGTANNATQSTTTQQLQIYNGTAVITENGKPALLSDGTQLFSLVSLSVGNLNDFGCFVIGKNTDASPAFNSIASVRTTGSPSTLAYRTSQISYAGTIYGTASTNTTYNLISIYADNTSSDVKGYFNQSQIFTTTPSSVTINGLTIASSGGVISSIWDGTIQEVILYPASTKADHTNIEGNINTYFSIF